MSDHSKTLPRLALQGVSKQFRAPGGSVVALDKADLTLNSGDFLAVQGPSGGGKSTLLLTASLLLRPDSGAVSWDGETVSHLDEDALRERRSRKIGFIWQQFHLVPYLTVLQNILSPALALGKDDQACLAERAAELLERLHLPHRAHHLPNALSTGERQRTAIGRALLLRPLILFADEPTGNLDEENTEHIMQLLREFAVDGGAVLMVTHDSRAAQSATRHSSLHQGELQ